MSEKRVYTFGNGKAEGKADMRNLLGGKMRTTCFEPYQAYWLELFFDNRKCNKIRLANRLTTRSRFGTPHMDSPFTSHYAKRKRQFLPSLLYL